MQIVDLPSEIIYGILIYLHNPTDTLQFTLTCRTFAEIGTERLYESICLSSMSQRKSVEKYLDYALNLVSPTNSNTSKSASLFIRRIKNLQSLDFGFGPHNELSSSESRRGSQYSQESEQNLEDSSELYGRIWSHRFISPSIFSILEFTPKLRQLDLRGCQFYDSLLAHTLASLGSRAIQSQPIFQTEAKILEPAGIQVINASYSSIKNLGLNAIAENCNKLEKLYLNGVFRFGRQDGLALIEIVKKCPNLRVLSILNSPMVFEDVRNDLLDVRKKMVVDGKSSVGLEIYWSDGNCENIGRGYVLPISFGSFIIGRNWKRVAEEENVETDSNFGSGSDNSHETCSENLNYPVVSKTSLGKLSIACV
ncbi:hypothetical protein HK098_007801 [Nowakowskiella sp. JEL0407]|nr:hypothetical protein HK098_007801 [Nowakowskiella sp. JEL0407]